MTDSDDVEKKKKRIDDEAEEERLLLKSKRRGGEREVPKSSRRFFPSVDIIVKKIDTHTHFAGHRRCAYTPGNGSSSRAHVLTSHDGGGDFF